MSRGELLAGVCLALLAAYGFGLYALAWREQARRDRERETTRRGERRA